MSRMTAWQRPRPSFDQNLYAARYGEYSKDPGLPLFNRALQALSYPGSTFKPAVAVAALDTGCNQHSTVYCDGGNCNTKDCIPAAPAMATAKYQLFTAIKWSPQTSISMMWAAAWAAMSITHMPGNGR